jgi:type II secretion system protein G
MKSQKGFTLIELLVVIAIVGILSSVVLASLNIARAKARDAKRLSDLKQIQAALAMFYSDNGAYPATTTWWGNCPTYGSYGTGATGYIPGLVPNYIKELPLDPKPIGTNNCYLYKSSGSNDYMFLAYGTVEGTVPVPVSLRRPGEPSSPTYAAYSGAGSGY